MYEGYNRIFWGVFITLFNINLGPINILPNFAGYLLMVSGLNILYKESSLPIFQRVGSLGGIVALLSFIGGIINFFSQSLVDYFFIKIIWMIGFVILELVFLFKIVEAYIKHLEQNNYNNEKEEYIKKLRYYIIFNILYILLMEINLIINMDVYPIFLGIMGMILQIYLMHMVYGLRNIFQRLEIDEE